MYSKPLCGLINLTAALLKHLFNIYALVLPTAPPTRDNLARHWRARADK